MNSLGERLHYARKKNRYTQESLADAIGVSRGVIFNLEKNKTEPQKIVVNAICRILKINKDWLLLGLGDMEVLDETSQSDKILEELYQNAKDLSVNELLFLLDSVKLIKTYFTNDQQ